MALTSFGMVAFYIADYFDISLLAGNPLSIDIWAAGLAAVAGVLSIVGYLLIHYGKTAAVMTVSYLVLALAIAELLHSSGGLSSPYIALWIFIAMCAGLFRVAGFIGIGTISHLYLGWLLTNGEPITVSMAITFILAAELPLVVSYIVWYEHHTPREGETTYSALVRELGQVANKSEIVINAIADGVIAIDAKGVIQLINPAAQAIVGWGKQDANGLDYRSVLKLVNQEGKELNEYTDPIQKCLTTNTPVVTEDFSLQTMSGKTLMISILVSPVGHMDARGGAIIVFRDITAAQEENRQQAEFISTASHEMRTPVAAIEGYLGLALNPQTAVIDDKARTYLTKAHESAQHLGRLFQDLLDVSRAEDGRLKVSPTVIDVVHYVREISESFRVAAEQKNLKLVYVPDQEETAGPNQHLSPAFYVYADADHLREVMSNLIENAIKYTREGTITVDVQGDSDNVRIMVSDTGIGIPPEDIPHLFQKFYRVDNTDTREIGGTGLGLYLSRRLIEAVNGHLELESEYRKGSTFTIDLPRLKNEEAMRKIELASQEKTS